MVICRSNPALDPRDIFPASFPATDPTKKLHTLISHPEVELFIAEILPGSGEAAFIHNNNKLQHHDTTRDKKAPTK